MTKSLQKFLFVLSCTFYLCLVTSYSLKTLEVTENDSQLFVFNEIISLGTIFDSAVFFAKQSQAQFSPY